MLADFVWQHRHLLQFDLLLADGEAERLRAVGYHADLLADGETRRRHRHRVGVRAELHAVVTFFICVGKADDTLHTLGRHGDVGIHRLALRVRHRTLNHRLRPGHDVHNGEEKKQERALSHKHYFPHFIVFSLNCHSISSGWKSV